MPEGEGETTTPSRPVSRLSDADAEQDIAEQDIAEHYCFAPTHAPLKVIRDTLYDSPELCNAIEAFLEKNWQGFKIDVHGTFSVGVEVLHRQFQRLVEKGIEAALDEAGYSQHDLA